MTKRFRTRATLALFALLLPLASAATADVRLPHIFGSHMVLQRDRPVIVWGWATPGEVVSADVGTARGQATANAAGEWRVTLPALAASDAPLTLTVSGSATRVVLDDVLVGEVWLCSGQSNMEFGLKMTRNAAAEVAAADVPGLRLMRVEKAWRPTPQADVAGQWQPCTPATVSTGGWNGFSAVAYFYGRELHKELGVPVGLIEASWGGTRIEPWTPPEGFAAVPALAADDRAVRTGIAGTPEHDRAVAAAAASFEAWAADAKRSVADRAMPPPVPTVPAAVFGPDDVQAATALYNGMIRPICPFGIRGAIWYQGESNEAEGPLYTERMKALVGGWRTVWGEGDFPFYYVQVAPYNYGDRPTRLPELWAAQAAAEAIPNTGMVVTNDIGNTGDIHPTDKQDVSHRLALRALADTYGRTGTLARSPTFKSLATEGATLRVTFDHAGTGLASRDGKPLTWFEVADQDSGGFQPATATVDGASVLLTSQRVKAPTAVRFAWSMLAEPNLMNSARLPASAFSAGTVPVRDDVTPNVPELKDYTLVYDLDLATVDHDVRYAVDDHAKVTRPFDRVAYALELGDAAGHHQWVYASLDAFTADPAKVGVPTAASGARFQQNVAHLDVYSNVPGVTTGQDLAGGNVEFWPNNYGPANAAGVPGASGDTFDFGDQPADELVDGYGSMQVHNHDARQTVLAINHWRDGDGADLGIGNAPGPNPDWTFSKNAGGYATRRLRVFVRLK